MVCADPHITVFYGRMCRRNLNKKAVETLSLSAGVLSGGASSGLLAGGINKKSTNFNFGMVEIWCILFLVLLILVLYSIAL